LPASRNSHSLEAINVCASFYFIALVSFAKKATETLDETKKVDDLV
jgi:hypothetical protein